MEEKQVVCINFHPWESNPNLLKFCRLDCISLGKMKGGFGVLFSCHQPHSKNFVMEYTPGVYDRVRFMVIYTLPFYPVNFLPYYVFDDAMNAYKNGVISSIQKLEVVLDG